MKNQLERFECVGEIIRRELANRRMSIAELARELHCSRSSLYAMFRGYDVSVQRLILIGKALDYDFLGEIADTHPTPQALPMLTIPIVDGHPDMTHLPVEMVEMLRRELERR